MEKKISVTCECEGTGFIAGADNGDDGVEHVECGQHHPAFEDAPSVDELFSSHRKPDRNQQRVFQSLGLCVEPNTSALMTTALSSKSKNRTSVILQHYA